jgi:hypothetical protein
MSWGPVGRGRLKYLKIIFKKDYEKYSEDF